MYRPNCRFLSSQPPCGASGASSIYPKNLMALSVGEPLSSTKVQKVLDDFFNDLELELELDRGKDSAHHISLSLPKFVTIRRP